MASSTSCSGQSLVDVIGILVCCFRLFNNIIVVAMPSNPSSPVGDYDIEFYVREELPGSSFVGSVADFEVGPAYRKSIRYRFLRTTAEMRSSTSAGVDLSAMFTIDEATGEIRTAGPLDRDEYCPRARLCVSRLDVVVQHLVMSSSSVILSTGSRLGIVRVGVHVVDINDNAPTFPSPIVSRSIAESANVGSAGFSIPAADDIDGPLYGTRKYIVVGNNEFSSSYSSAPFNITSVTGGVTGGLNEGSGHQLRLTPTEQLDREISDR